MHVGFWLGKPEGKRPLGIPKLRWDDIISMNHKMLTQTIRVHLAQVWDQQRSVVTTAVNLCVSYNTESQLLAYMNDWWLLKKDTAATCSSFVAIRY